VNWLKKAKDAFARLKGRAVKHAEVKEWGINIVNKLFAIIGIDKRVGCPPRQIQDTLIYDSLLVLELRIPMCEEKDVDKMWEAVRIVAREAMELTPRDTGVLQTSQYTNVMVEEGGKTIAGFIGYRVQDVFRITPTGKTVYYALAVHNREARHTQDLYPNNPPRATWRFLEIAWQNRYIQKKVRGLFNERATAQ
jgi:hypothetical protein